MRQLKVVALIGLIAGIPLAVRAISLTGILLYATDDFGNPSGWDEQQQDFAQKQLWRTAFGGTWHGLGVLSGFPPESLRGLPLNAADFTIDIPLIEGDNDFTILGEPGGYTARDDFTAFAVNLYFDGVTDRPGISVVFPGDAPWAGAAPAANRSERLFQLSVERSPHTQPSATYAAEDMRVWVSRASFVRPEAIVSVDVVSEFAPAPNGTSDWLGVLRIHVEPPPTPPPDAVAGNPPRPRPVGPRAFGIIPDDGRAADTSGGFPMQGGADDGGSLEHAGAVTPVAALTADALPSAEPTQPVPVESTPASSQGPAAMSTQSPGTEEGATPAPTRPSPVPDATPSRSVGPSTPTAGKTQIPSTPSRSAAPPNGTPTAKGTPPPPGPTPASTLSE